MQVIARPPKRKSRGTSIGGSLKPRELNDHDREVIERAKAALDRPEPARGRSEKKGGWD